MIFSAICFFFLCLFVVFGARRWRLIAKSTGLPLAANTICKFQFFLFSCLHLTFFPFCGFIFTATFRSYNAHFVAQLFESFWTRPSCLLSFALALLLLTGILSAVIIILVLLLIRRTHFYFGFHSHFHWLRHCQPKTLQLLLLPRYLWIRTDRWDSHIISLGSEIVTHLRCWFFPK